MIVMAIHAKMVAHALTESININANVFLDIRVKIVKNV
jgi:hypothetical protein